MAGIRARFGPEFVPGGRIRQDVLAAFRQLEPGGAGLVGSRQVWRRRNALPPPADGRA